MSRVRDQERAQPTLFAPASEPRWRLEGTRCSRCGRGPMRMRHASDVCDRPDPSLGRCEACGAARSGLCQLTAEGYAVCDACGSLAQVWPDDMVGAA